MDQTDLAEQIGVTQGTISLLLRGKTQNSRHLPAIARALAVNVDWVAGLSDTRIDMFDLDGEQIEEAALPGMIRDPAFIAQRVFRDDAEDAGGGLTAEEREWLDLLRGIAPADRAAILQLARTLSSCATTPAVHGRKSDYRAG